MIVVIMMRIIGGFYGVRTLTGGNNGTLTASGKLEATTVNVSPELAVKLKVIYTQGRLKPGIPADVVFSPK